ncbi:hypothetical protein AQB9606_04710 [Aquabacterium sp. CECT 9606]|nr:hypothetical protein AQB9606_04710 [Aquabacterium sp. CECT 9606]
MRHPTGVVTLGVNAIVVTVLTIARPGDDEASRAHRNGRIELIGTRVGVDAELAALGHTAGVVALRINAITRPILQLAPPGDHKVATVVHRHRRLVLVARASDVGIDLEFTRQGRAIGVIQTAIHIIRDGVFPNHHIVAVGCRGNLFACILVGLLGVAGSGVRPGFRANTGHRSRQRRAVAARENTQVVSAAIAAPSHDDLIAAPGHAGDLLVTSQGGVDDGFGRELDPGQTELPHRNAVAVAICGIGLPGGHKTTIAAHGHRRVPLRAVDEIADQNLAALSDTAAVVGSRVGTVAIAISQRVIPGDDKVPGCIHRHIRQNLLPRCRDVDPELRTLGHATGVVALGIDAITRAILRIARPGNDEVAAVIHADLATLLDVRVGRVDLELGALGHATGVVTLGIDTIVVAILAIAGPGDDEARGVHRDGGIELVGRRVGVDAELAALSDTAGVVALRVDAVTRSVLRDAAPGDDKVAIGIHRDRGLILGCGRVRVNSELGSGCRAIGVVKAAINAQGGSVFPDHHVVAVGIGRHLLARVDVVFLGARGCAIDRRLGGAAGCDTEQVLPCGLACRAHRHLGFNRALLVLKYPVAAQQGGPRQIVAGRHIGPGEQRQVVHQGPALAGAGQVTAIQQQIGLGGQGATPRSQITHVPGEPSPVQPTIAQLQTTGIAVADDVQGINAFPAFQDLGDLRNAIALVIEPVDFQRATGRGLALQKGRQLIGIGHAGVYEHQLQ